MKHAKSIAMFAVLAIALSGFAVLAAGDSDSDGLYASTSDTSTAGLNDEKQEEKTDVGWLAWLIVLLAIVEFAGIGFFIYHKTK